MEMRVARYETVSARVEMRLEVDQIDVRFRRRRQIGEYRSAVHASTIIYKVNVIHLKETDTKSKIYIVVSKTLTFTKLAWLNKRRSSAQPNKQPLLF